MAQKTLKLIRRSSHGDQELIEEPMQAGLSGVEVMVTEDSVLVIHDLTGDAPAVQFPVFEPAVEAPNPALQAQAVGPGEAPSEGTPPVAPVDVQASPVAQNTAATASVAAQDPATAVPTAS